VQDARVTLSTFEQGCAMVEADADAGDGVQNNEAIAGEGLDIIQ
jgi:hypothetical protein